jgi:hypothetical protein
LTTQGVIDRASYVGRRASLTFVSFLKISTDCLQGRFEIAEAQGFLVRHFLISTRFLSWFHDNQG